MRLLAILIIVSSSVAGAQSALPPLPAPIGVPKPGPITDAPYAPQPIVPGGVVVPLYAAGSPFLNAKRVREAEVYTLSQTVPGRINSIVNIHNPSIEFHPVDRAMNTGAAVILVPGGGHNALVIGSEAADFVPFFYQHGVNTVILRYRLRRDGYNAETDAVYDAQQAIRLVRAYAKEWNLDPNRIGIIGFSAGAELSAPSALDFDAFDRRNAGANDPFAGVALEVGGREAGPRVERVVEDERLRPDGDHPRHVELRIGAGIRRVDVDGDEIADRERRGERWDSCSVPLACRSEPWRQRGSLHVPQPTLECLIAARSCTDAAFVGRQRDPVQRGDLGRLDSGRA